MSARLVSTHGGQKVFVYQAAEYDLSGPGGQGTGGLAHFFANRRASPVPRLEVQATYHRGRSIDARSITLDLLNGRPVSSRTLEGFLYQSAGTRVTVTIARNLRVFGGYARDKNNRDDEATTRTTAGVWSSNLFGTGIDLRASQSRMQGPHAEYDAWDLSLGRSLGPRLYLTFDDSSSLSAANMAAGCDPPPFGGWSYKRLNRIPPYGPSCHALVKNEYRCSNGTDRGAGTGSARSS